LKHAEDFRSVIWFGHYFTFTPMQAAAVKILWEAWERGLPDVPQQYILTEIESDSAKLQYLFKKSPAYRKMIVQGARSGYYRLQELPPPATS
jgi:hypothetical protein